MKEKKPKGKSRSAKTGKYVTKDFAQKHPNTTVTESTSRKDKKTTDKASD